MGTLINQFDRCEEERTLTDMIVAFENKDIEKLATMIARGFDEVGQRLDEHDERFASIDKRFTSIDERFTSIDERFTSIDERFAQMDRRFTALEQKVDAGFKSVREDINALASDHFPRSAQKNVFERIERIEDHIGLSHELATA